MELAGAEPDAIIACCGGGTRPHIAFPFIHKKITEKKEVSHRGGGTDGLPVLLKVTCATNFGDTAEMTPLLMMYTLGHKFMPPPIHAGGLRYHGMSPMVSHVLKLGLMEAEAYHQTKVFEAGDALCAQAKASCPRRKPPTRLPRSWKRRSARTKRERSASILFNLSGHGLLDLSAYETYLTGKLQDV